MISKNKIEKHIQVLRCISVFLVIFYHLNLNLFSNGYLGVDIFFLISGYVITMKLYENYHFNNKKIDILKFWKKRIQRIYPILIFSFSITLIIFLCFGQLYLLRGLFEQFISSIFGVSNLYFLYHRVDYFNDLSSSPYLHAWSLAVEEQFYLLYPIVLSFLLYLLSKNQKIILKFIVFFLLFLSILFSLLYEKNNPQLSFYFPFLRFWEIGFGCLLFFLNFEKRKKFFKKNYIVIFSLIFFSIIIFYDYKLSYTLKNLLEIFFIALIINFYNSNSLTRLLFENKYLVYLGNISFSLYLWHLPIIYFLSLYFGNFNIVIPTIILTFMFSHFSYQYIEQKFRYFEIKGRKNIIIIFLIPTLVFIVLSYYLMTNEKLKNFVKNQVYKINYLEITKNYSSRVNFYLISINKNKIYDFCTDESKISTKDVNGLIVNCSKIHNNDNLFYFLGNSHTANFITAADNFKNVNFYYKHKSNPFEPDNADYLNDQINNFKNVIFVTSINNDDQLNKFLEFKTNLDNRIETLLIGPVPNVINFDPLKCLVRNNNCIIDIEEDYKLRNLNKLNMRLLKLDNEKDIKVFFPYNFLCINEKKKCSIYNTEKDILTHRDGSHLTAEGSLILVKPLNDFIKINF